MPRRPASPLCRVNETRIAPHISIAVPQASPSPWAKWASPTENKAPSTNTGNNSRAPLLSCLMSRLPPFSRGGIVRKASEAIGSVAGTAPRASGGSASPPRAASSASRRVTRSRSSREGATPITDKGAIGDLHIRQIGRLGKAVLDRPFGDIGFRERIAEKAEPRHLHRIAKAGRLHVADLDLEQIARLGAADKDRPGQRMDAIEIAGQQILSGGLRRDLAVKRIARLDLDLLAGSRFDHGRDRFVPAVMALLRLVGERLVVVDGDAFHIRLPERCAEQARLNAPLGQARAKGASAGGQPRARAARVTRSARSRCRVAACSRTRATTAGSVFSGEPAAKGGWGSYSIASWIALAAARPATEAATASATSMPAVTPPPVKILPSATIRAAIGSAPNARSMSRDSQ